MTLGTHPVALLRDELDGVVLNDDLAVLPDRREVEIAGVVVARQRPGTAKGVVFMLLEDETGVANVIVPPPVYKECRLAVRTAAYARVSGRLERNGKVINVLAASVVPLSMPNEPQAEVRTIEPDPVRETGRDVAPARAAPGCGRRSARGGCAGRAELRREGLRWRSGRCPQAACPRGFGLLASDLAARWLRPRRVLIVPNPCSNQRHRSGTA